MIIRVYYPISQKGKKELSKCTSIFHAEIVAEHISCLTCSSQQKIELIEEIIRKKTSTNINNNVVNDNNIDADNNKKEFVNCNTI